MSFVLCLCARQSKSNPATVNQHQREKQNVICDSSSKSIDLSCFLAWHKKSTCFSTFDECRKKLGGQDCCYMLPVFLLLVPSLTTRDKSFTVSILDRFSRSGFCHNNHGSVTFQKTEGTQEFLIRISRLEKPIFCLFVHRQS